MFPSNRLDSALNQISLDLLPVTENASHRNLHRLFLLRVVMIAFLAGTALGLAYLNIPLHFAAVTVALATMVLLNGITWTRLQRPRQIRESELLWQLLGDIAALTLLFYFTGGYSNPFVWMYLLPLAIAAVALSASHVWLVAGLAVGCYSALVFYHVPLSHLHVHALSGIGLDIHLVGMWLGFVLSAGILALFVARIGQTLRDYDRVIAEARETALENERMLALGTLAAGAAHELGTPLATMAVLTKELSADYAHQPDLVTTLGVLRQQVDRCKEILSSIAASAGNKRAEATHTVALDRFIEETVEDWRGLRPGVEFHCTLQSAIPAPLIAVDRTLSMALVNLLDNAADASPEHVEMHGGWTAGELDLSIRDHGAGLPVEAAGQIGTPFFTTKQDKGMGLGLYLARTILGRYGGTIALENHPHGGTITEIRLPLSGLIVGKTGR